MRQTSGDRQETDDSIFSDRKSRCKSCPLARGTTSWQAHCRRKAHQINAQQRAEIRRAAADQAKTTEQGPDASWAAQEPDPFPNRQSPAPYYPQDNWEDHLVWDRIEGICNLDPPTAPNSNTRTLVDDLVEAETEEAGRYAHYVPYAPPEPAPPREWDDTSVAAPQDMNGAHPAVEVPIRRTDVQSDRVAASPWFPFKDKLDSLQQASSYLKAVRC